MKQRILAVMLVLAMLTSMLTACATTTPGTSTDAPKSTDVPKSTASDNVQETAKADDAVYTEHGTVPVDHFAGTELTIAVQRRDGIGDTTEDFNEKPVVKMVEEATGIHINWIIIDGSVQSERMSTILSSGEYPDAYLGGLVSLADIAQSPDLFYDLSEEGLLETYIPDVLDDYINGGQDGLELITWPDDSIYSLLTNMGSSYHTDPYGVMYINQRWLDNVGLDVPTTMDEFYEVLCAFRDKDANGNGDPNDEIPLSFTNKMAYAHFMNLANPWGIYGTQAKNEFHYKMLDADGNVTGTVNTQAYREFLEYYHMLKEEGLIDVTGFSQTADQFYAKQKENLVGIFQEWTPKLNQEDFSVILPLSAEGYKGTKSGGQNLFFGTINGFVVSADCSNVEALLHWWNYMSSTQELKATGRYGVQGVDWHYDEEGRACSYTEAERKEMGVADNSQALNSIGNLASPYLEPALNGISKNYRYEMCSPVYEYLATEYLPAKRIAPLEAEEELNFIIVDLYPYIENFAASAVMDGITDDSWNAYLAGLEDYGYSQYLEFYQTYYVGDK